MVAAVLVLARKSLIRRPASRVFLFVGETSATRLTGKIARWQTGICPRVIGLPPGFSRFVTARLKAVAMEAGARASHLLNVLHEP